MSAQPLGIARDMAAKRESVASRLSPAARHQAFPTVYARPVPVADDRESLKTKIKALEGRLDAAKAKIRELSTENERLRDDNAALVQKGLRAMVESPEEGLEFLRHVRAIDVIGAFCQALNRYGFRVEDELWTLEHMRSARRSRNLARPRQVCMWTVTQVCKHLSLPSIGHAFGGRDHTTIIFGRDRAPEVIREMPLLGHCAREVMDKFRQPTLAPQGTATDLKRASPRAGAL